MDDRKAHHHSDMARASARPREFTRRLYGMLLRRLGNRADAEDLAQEAYLRLLRVERKKFIEKPDAYLFRIAANLANEFTMQRGAASTVIDIDEAYQLDTLHEENSLEKTLERRAEIRRLEVILENMPPAYRAVLILSKRDGLTREEIARELGLSVHTVKKYLARAAAWCRDELSE